MTLEYSVELHTNGRFKDEKELNTDQLRSYHSAKVGYELAYNQLKRFLGLGYKIEEIELIK